MELGDKNLLVQRASIGIMQAGGSEMSVNAMSLLAGTTSTDLEESRVLQLLNMVTAEELIDTDEYEGMYCATLTSGHTHFLKGTLTRRRNLRRRQGRMRQIWHRARPQNPRPSGGSRQSSGVGKIFIKFADVESAGRALRALAGRKFADRTVVTTYFSEVSWITCQLHITIVVTC